MIHDLPGLRLAIEVPLVKALNVLSVQSHRIPTSPSVLVLLSTGIVNSKSLVRGAITMQDSLK